MRRAPQEVRTYFITFVASNRRRIFQVEANANLLSEVIQGNRQKRLFELHGFVIMPDHVHLILTPAPEISLEKAIQFIKGGFSFRLKSRFEVWERGYNESQILTPEKFAACKRYIEENPVRALLADSPEEYSFSSAGKPEWTDARPRWLERTSRG